MSKDRSETQSKYTKTKESSVNKNGYVQKYVRKSEQNVVFLEGNKIRQYAKATISSIKHVRMKKSQLEPPHPNPGDRRKRKWTLRKNNEWGGVKDRGIFTKNQRISGCSRLNKVIRGWTETKADNESRQCTGEGDGSRKLHEKFTNQRLQRVK